MMAPVEQTKGQRGSIDPKRSACVLIGVDAYTDLEPLRSVRNNLTKLPRVLADKEIWGINPKRIEVVSNPEHQPDLIRPIRRMAKSAKDALIVYYSGHGIINRKDGELHLTLTGSVYGEPETTVPFSLVLEAIQDDVSAMRRVVILDCCL